MGDLADLLRPRDLLTAPDQAPLVMAAEVLDTDPLRVKVPEFDGGRNALSAFGPVGGLQEGDEVRVMLDAHGQFVVISVENAPTGGGAPSGPAGGVLSGTYPDPGFAADMATQAELADEITAREAADTDLAGDIATESGARAAADTNEATIRAAADTALDGRLDAIEGNYQPLDSDLTALAALATTAFGRSLLTQADAAAVRALIDAASNSVDSWTNVGSFLNSWVNFGGSDLVAAYYKDPWGVVHLRGVIKSGTVGSTAFTLPSGYRPPGTMRFAVDANGAFGYVAVTSAGNVVPAAGSNAEVNLADISFRNQ